LQIHSRIRDASLEDREEVGRRARELQELHTQRLDLVESLDRRLNCPQTVPVAPTPRPEWLWSDVGTPATWKQAPEAPAGLAGRALTAWAKARHNGALKTHHDELDVLLQACTTLSVEIPTTNSLSALEDARRYTSTTGLTPLSSPPNGDTPSAIRTSPSSIG
jgi:hypothetical protein